MKTVHTCTIGRRKKMDSKFEMGGVRTGRTPCGTENERKIDMTTDTLSRDRELRWVADEVVKVLDSDEHEVVVGVDYGDCPDHVVCVRCADGVSLEIRKENDCSFAAYLMVDGNRDYIAVALYPRIAGTKLGDFIPTTASLVQAYRAGRNRTKEPTVAEALTSNQATTSEKLSQVDLDLRALDAMVQDVEGDLFTGSDLDLLNQTLSFDCTSGDKLMFVRDLDKWRVFMEIRGVKTAETVVHASLGLEAVRDMGMAKVNVWSLPEQATGGEESDEQAADRCSEAAPRKPWVLPKRSAGWEERDTLVEALSKIEGFDDTYSFAEGPGHSFTTKFVDGMVVQVRQIPGTEGLAYDIQVPDVKLGDGYHGLADSGRSVDEVVSMVEMIREVWYLLPPDVKEVKDRMERKQSQHLANVAISLATQPETEPTLTPPITAPLLPLVREEDPSAPVPSRPERVFEVETASAAFANAALDAVAVAVVDHDDFTVTSCEYKGSDAWIHGELPHESSFSMRMNAATATWICKIFYENRDSNRARVSSEIDPRVIAQVMHQLWKEAGESELSSSSRSIQSDVLPGSVAELHAQLMSAGIKASKTVDDGVFVVVAMGGTSYRVVMTADSSERGWNLAIYRVISDAPARCLYHSGMIDCPAESLVKVARAVLCAMDLK